MLRKSILILCLPAVFVIITTVLASCLTRTETLCSIRMQTDNQGTEPEDLTEEIVFRIYSETYCKAYKPQPLSFVTSSYATTVCILLKNPPLTETFDLSFDRPFLFDGDTIKPGTNVLKVDVLKDTITITDLFERCNGYGAEIRFPKELKSRLTFDGGIYTANFKCLASDLKELTARRMVILRRQ